MTSERNDKFLSQVEKVRTEIEAKFAHSQKVLEDRKATLLSELEKLVEGYRGRGEGTRQQIEELERLKELQLSSVKGNENKEIVRESVAVLEAHLRELSGKLQREIVSMRSVELKWDENATEKLSEFGKIELRGFSVCEGKREPTTTFCKHSYKETTSPELFCYPNSIATDPQTGNVCVCDSGNNRIQVFTKELEFLFDFKEKIDWPAGIYISNNKIYTTQLGTSSLNVYSTEGEFIESVGKKGKGKLEFLSPSGIAVSEERRIVYICEYDNERVQCLTTDLTFHSSIGNISSPRDVKLSSEEVVVLSSGDPCIRYFNHAHQPIRQTVPRGVKGQVVNPWYFCIDKAWNIVMTDTGTNSVVTFSKEGELLRRFGEEGEGEGEFISVKGIALDSEGRIVVASENPNHCIQVFQP